MNPEKKFSIEQIKAFQDIFDFFNDNLFNGELPPVILNFSRSSAKTIAFFKPNTWTPEENPDVEDRLHELSLTPRFLNRSKKETFSTIVHEQCHLWQHTFGKKKSRAGYHNREWADKMLEVGLKPISGNGGMTGQSVTHDIIAEGKFEKVFMVSEKELRLPFIVLNEDRKKASRQTRSKYYCDKCLAIVYGKKDLKIFCGDCDVQYKISE